jgi:hypothetical protein
MSRIRLIGDAVVAAGYAGFARKKARAMQDGLIRSEKASAVKKIQMHNAVIRILASPKGYSVTIEGKGKKLYIIAAVGETTATWGPETRKFYAPDGTEVQEPKDIRIFDDGKYVQDTAVVDSDDPDALIYAYDPSGVGVAATINSGMAALKVEERTVRYILNQAMEDEVHDFHGDSIWGVASYNYCAADVSAIYAPWKLKGKAGMVRYAGDEIISLHHLWSGQLGIVATSDNVQSGSFADNSPRAARIYRQAIGSKVGREYIELECGRDPVVLATKQFGSAPEVEIVRAVDFDWFGGTSKVYDYTGVTTLSTPPAVPVDGETHIVGEAPTGAWASIIPGTAVRWNAAGPYWVAGTRMLAPFKQEKYSFTDPKTDVDEWTRCSDPANDTCHYLLPGLSSGVETISDDVLLPFGIGPDGLTGVRNRKASDMATANMAVVCNGQVVEATGDLDTVVLHSTDAYGPVIILPVRFEVIHSHHDGHHNAVVFRKTTVQEYSSELLPYKMWNSGIGANAQVRKTTVRSIMTYHINVNGITHDLPYTCEIREYIMTLAPDAYSGPAVPTLSFLHTNPWVDVGYDADGVELDGSDANRNMTRVFTSATPGLLILAVDAFPVKYRHSLNQKAVLYDAITYQALVPEYDEVVSPKNWPTTSDGDYPDAPDRLWRLFHRGGGHVMDAKTPMKADGVTAWNRVNGLALVEV